MTPIDKKDIDEIEIELAVFEQVENSRRQKTEKKAHLKNVVFPVQSVELPLPHFLLILAPGAIRYDTITSGFRSRHDWVRVCAPAFR